MGQAAARRNNSMFVPRAPLVYNRLNHGRKRVLLLPTRLDQEVLMWISRKARLMVPILMAAAVMAAAPTNARIEKSATLSKTGILLYWWPALGKVKGWHHDQAASQEGGINAEVPDGFTFANAMSVIYAKAIYKPRQPETKTLAMLIKEDRATFLAHDRTLKITRIEPLKTADGRFLQTYTYFPREKGNWEEVSYGEEGDYYLVFVISSRTKAGFEKAVAAYKEFISEYQ